MSDNEDNFADIVILTPDKTDSMTDDKEIDSHLENLCLPFINPHMHKIGPRRPKHYIFGNQFYSKKCQEAQIPCIPPFKCQKTYDIIILPEVDLIDKKFVDVFQFRSGPR